MGVAMNHIASVMMPFVGGLLWKYAGYRWAFLTGVAAALVSVGLSLCLPRHKTNTGCDNSGAASGTTTA